MCIRDSAQLLVDEARALLKASDFSTADDRAEEATLYAGVDLTQAARAVQQDIDDARAERAAKRAIENASAGKCASALKAVADPVRAKARQHFKTALKDKTKAALFGCLEQKLAEEVKAGNVEAARSLLTAPDTTTAFDKESYAKLEKVLQQQLVHRGPVSYTHLTLPTSDLE